MESYRIYLHLSYITVNSSLKLFSVFFFFLNKFGFLLLYVTMLLKTEWIIEISAKSIQNFNSVCVHGGKTLVLDTAVGFSPSCVIMGKLPNLIMFPSCKMSNNWDIVRVEWNCESASLMLKICLNLHWQLCCFQRLD